MKNSVEIFKNGGFYSVYNNDTYILYYLFGYKIIDNRVGFPLKAYDKVINKFDDLKISYCNKNSNEEKNFKKLNKYNYYLEKGKSKYSLSYRIDKVLSKLICLSEADIDSILKYIEDKINE